MFILVGGALVPALFSVWLLVRKLLLRDALVPAAAWRFVLGMAGEDLNVNNAGLATTRKKLPALSL